MATRGRSVLVGLAIVLGVLAASAYLWNSDARAFVIVLLPFAVPGVLLIGWAARRA